MDPHYVVSHYRLGLADLWLRQWKPASDALERAAELDSGRVDVHLALAELLFAAKQFDRCENEATLVLQKEPNNAQAYRLLGGSLLARHQNDPALKAFTKLAQLRPQESPSYWELTKTGKG